MEPSSIVLTLRRSIAQRRHRREVDRRRPLAERDQRLPTRASQPLRRRVGMPPAARDERPRSMRSKILNLDSTIGVGPIRRSTLARQGRPREAAVLATYPDSPSSGTPRGIGDAAPIVAAD